jgi:hypothetical protein
MLRAGVAGTCADWAVMGMLVEALRLRIPLGKVPGVEICVVLGGSGVFGSGFRAVCVVLGGTGVFGSGFGAVCVVLGITGVFGSGFGAVCVVLGGFGVLGSGFEAPRASSSSLS